jgi:CheY-like chemotaxis protein
MTRTLAIVKRYSMPKVPCFFVSKGFKGIALANQHDLEAIVLNYSMPNLNGKEVARALKLAFPNWASTSLLYSKS